MYFTEKLLFISIMLGIYTNEIKCANILHLSFTPSPSHTIWDKTIAIALWRRGHKITFVSHATLPSMENFTTIEIEGTLEKIDKVFKFEMMLQPDTPIRSIMEQYEYFTFSSEYIMYNKGMNHIMDLIHRNITYDLIVYDVTLAHNLYPLIQKFGSPPVVGTSPFGMWPYLRSTWGIDTSDTYIPHKFLTYTGRMTLLQRLVNHLYNQFAIFWHNYIYIPAQWNLAQKFFGKDIPHISDIEKNISILLINNDPNIDYPQVFPPGVIPCGGLTSTREDELPKDIKSYLDQGINGVILFSLGTNIRSDAMSRNTIQDILNAFSMLNQTILWKFESSIEHVPTNVIIRKFLPQSSILAHPNTKLFITHGGSLSLQEAVYYEKPVVIIPFFADHHYNMLRVVDQKWGIELQYSDITTHRLLKSVEEAMYNPMYKRNVEEISRRYRDQPQDALSRAVFWVEYTLRHGGAHHLNTRGRSMFFYQVNLLDVWLLLVFSVSLTFYITYKLFRMFYCYTEIKLKTS